MSEFSRLEKLCGLSPDVLAEVLENNPRAYMAVKGAVAEKHLERYFERLLSQGEIADFRPSSGDFEKDFYIVLNDKTEVVVECKNVQVLNISTKKSYLEYLRFVKRVGLLEGIKLKDADDYKASELREIFNSLPQRFRESGIPRYEFSESLIEQNSINGKMNNTEFLRQFDLGGGVLSIDFQRTRNSRDRNSVEDSKAARFYRIGEIDIVGACLFSRTMKWEFVFGNRDSFLIHSKYKDRYSNKLVLKPGLWHFDFLSTIKS